MAFFFICTIAYAQENYFLETASFLQNTSELLGNSKTPLANTPPTTSIVNAHPSEETLAALAASVTWHRLIYFRSKPEVISANFYLSDTQHFSALSELKESLLFFNRGGDPCSYPARHFWLYQKRLIHSAFDYSKCNFKGSKLNHAISIVLVSEYIQNPASAFGHLLIRNQSSKHRLLDEGINYGAKIPPDTNSIEYIVQGLTGRYESGYTTDIFYRRDLVYTQTENRDMYEYTLNLSLEDKQLLYLYLNKSLHLKTKYYFLKQNCAYRFAELIELLLNKNIIDSRPWYAPEMLFSTLPKLRHNNKKLVTQVVFYPSKQRLLYQQLKELNIDDLKRVNASIKHLENQQGVAIEQLNSTASLDFMHYYLDYIKLDLSPSIYDSNKNKLIAKRIQLPAQTATLATQASEFNTGNYKSFIPISKLSLSASDETQGAQIGASVYHRSLLASPKANEYQLIALSSNAQLSDAIKINDVTLLDIIKLSDARNKLYGEDKISWQVHIGANRQQSKNLTLASKLGVGGYTHLTQNISAYSFLNMLYQGNNVQFNPQLGILYKPNTQLNMQLTLEPTLTENKKKFSILYKLQQSQHISIDFSETGNKVSIDYYW